MSRPDTVRQLHVAVTVLGTRCVATTAPAVRGVREVSTLVRTGEGLDTPGSVTGLVVDTSQDRNRSAVYKSQLGGGGLNIGEKGRKVWTG